MASRTRNDHRRRNGHAYCGDQRTCRGQAGSRRQTCRSAGTDELRGSRAGPVSRGPGPSSSAFSTKRTGQTGWRKVHARGFSVVTLSPAELDAGADQRIVRRFTLEDRLLRIDTAGRGEPFDFLRGRATFPARHRHFEQHFHGDADGTQVRPCDGGHIERAQGDEEGQDRPGGQE